MKKGGPVGTRPFPEDASERLALPVLVAIRAALLRVVAGAVARRCALLAALVRLRHAGLLLAGRLMLSGLLLARLLLAWLGLARLRRTASALGVARAIPLTLLLAKRTEGLVRQNLGIALLYNLAAVPLAILGFVTPLIAAIAMSSSSIIVILNALRLGKARLS